MKLIKLLKIMKKQRICIIGDGLSGLITAQILSKLDVQIDLFSKKKQKKIPDNRTTAISPSNYEFVLKSLGIKNSNLFYKCKKVNLYYEKNKNNYLNFLNFENSGKNLMFIIQNKNLRNLLTSSIKKNKKIKNITKNIQKIDVEKTSVIFGKKKYFYDMILLCVGKNYAMVENLIGKRFIKEDKREIAFTCIVNHRSNITESKQYFLKEGPMALLPINNNKLSLIWSMNQKFKKYRNKQIKNLILLKLKEFDLNNNKINLKQIESFPIYFKFNRKFFKNNIFAIGESAYNVYPIAGQGFNLVLRDINELYKKIKKNISLGLQIKDSLIFNDLYSRRKPENLLYGMGINLTQSFFRSNNFTDPLKNTFLKDIDKFQFLKKIGLKIADKGIIN